MPRANSVKYPHIRHNVMDSLAVLADIEYQQRVWVNSADSGRYDDFDLDIHILYDDTNVLTDPEDNLGFILLPGEELDRLRASARSSTACCKNSATCLARSTFSTPTGPR